LVPAWDWKGSEQIHARMSVVRGIENGFSVVRPSREGLVTVSDRYGRMLAEKSTFNKKDATLIVEVPISPQRTLYSRFGDWFGWLTVGITILACVIALLNRMTRIRPPVSIVLNRLNLWTSLFAFSLILAAVKSSGAKQQDAHDAEP
jgi:hypothetical protein